MRVFVFLLLGLSLLCSSCRKEELIFVSDSSVVSIPVLVEEYQGFYLLNEGNMGMNRATIDWFDYEQGVYTRDIFSERNPTLPRELGDVGNDLKIYGKKAYATINASNFVEVFDVATAKHIKQIHVPNCRYLTFDQGKVYVSSFSGKIEVDPNAEIGFVAEIDTVSLTITRKVNVGYQPEEMAVYRNKLYVANSGGYREPNYDTTVSVVDLTTFTEIKKIEVAPNLHRMQVDKNGDVYVSARGNYNDISPSLYVIDSAVDQVKQKLDIPVANMTIDDAILYYYTANYQTGGGKTTSYGMLDIHTKQLIRTSISTDGTDQQLFMPYGIAVNPESKDIFITDAQDYIGNGYVYCYSAEGLLKWKAMSGNVPAHIAFVKKDSWRNKQEIRKDKKDK
ncbi:MULTISPECIES: YncE family protein [unclassified Myroides]|uniref:YncE family protein n=1 Tax=unclassified Myroides TaxID=2642485 RepID=UPI0015F928D1|nr:MULTISPECIES: YncE family protein [unclassified Myroides]MBB1148584.1 YncE family protein [Myroides sp. NP-2]MDM1406297.1 YncE family protein [Myroides sp. DF42-4-2]